MAFALFLRPRIVFIVRLLTPLYHIRPPCHDEICAQRHKCSRPFMDTETARFSRAAEIYLRTSVGKVLKAYEGARALALSNPSELKKSLAAYTKLPEPVLDRQLERTELTHSAIGQPQVDTIVAAGLALQEAGVIPENADVRAAVDALVDRRFATASR